MTRATGGDIYDEIGRDYARHRRPDPRWERAIWGAVGDAATIVNVGAGAGSYEPSDVDLVAVEPSTVMAAQRPLDRAPVVRAVAESLPFSDDRFDVGLAVLTVHHWADWRAGLAELRRVSRRQVVVTFDVDACAQVWLLADYLPEATEMDRERTPTTSEVAAAIGDGQVAPLFVPFDMQDAVMLAHWGRPEAYLDSTVRAAASGFAQLPRNVVDHAIARLEADLTDGSWDARHGHLRDLTDFDAGYRIVTNGDP